MQPMQQEGHSASSSSVGSGQKESKLFSPRRNREPLPGTKRDSAAISPNIPTDGLYGQIMVSGHHSDIRSAKYDVTRRKETARRQLMGSIYTKHNNVRRSFSFVAGERPPVEVRFPRVFYNEKQDRVRDSISPRQDASKCVATSNTNIKKRQRKRSDHSAVSQSLTIDNATKEAPVHSRLSRTSSQKLSLPGIIMDFNLSANMAALGRGQERMTSETASDDDEERMFGVSYEDYLKRTQVMQNNNPIRGKHRPVTPGLLETLNKLKLPSKVKTEQWVKASQSSKKSYYVDTYRIGPLDSSNKMAYPNWIYTDP